MNNKRTLVILAAGTGTRLQPLTFTTPKPLIKILNKPIIEHNIISASLYINEIVLVVGHLEEKIKDYFKNSFKGIPIKYVTQDKICGNAYAFHLTRDVVSNDKLIVTYGDDIYSPDLFKKIVNFENGLIGIKKEDWRNFGVLKTNQDGNLEELVEKPSTFVGDLVNVGLYAFDKKIFDYYSKIGLSIRGEYEITDMVTLFAKDTGVKVVEALEGWMPISYPWQMFLATEALLKNLKTDLTKGEVEKGVTIKGKVKLGKGSIIKSGTYIEGNFQIGENCIIGPNCYLKDFGVIGDGCQIGNGVEFSASTMGDNTKIDHLSFVGNSILGNNIRVGGGTIFANRRHDRKNINLMICNKKVDTGTNRFGAVIGDDVKFGINSSINAGVKINNNLYTLPGEIVLKDKVK